MKNLSLCLLVLLTLFTALLPACELFNSSNKEDSPFDPVFDTSKSDLLFEWQTKKGSKIRMFGEKKENVGVEYLSAARVQLPEKDEPVIYKFDKKNRPIYVLTANETEYWFSWTNDKNIRVTVEAPSDTAQISFDFNLNATSSLWTKVSQNKISSKRKHRYSTRNGTLKIDVRSINCKKSSVLSGKMVTSSVTVTKCGEPVNDALVVLHAYFNDEEGDLGPIDFGNYTGNGIYAIDIPRPDAKEKRFEKTTLCSSTKEEVKELCTITTAMTAGGIGVAKFCSTLRAAALASPIPGFDQAVVNASCGGFIAGLLLMCNVPTIKCATVDIFDWLDITNSDLFVWAVVTTDSDGFVFNEKKVPENGPVPSFEVSFEGTVSIQNLTINPADPDPEEDYVANSLIEGFDLPSLFGFLI